MAGSENCDAVLDFPATFRHSGVTGVHTGRPRSGVFVMKKSRILELSTLIGLNACRDQVELFRVNFGESVEVTEELCLSVSDRFAWTWAAENLLSAPAWAEYARVATSALAEYERAVAPALAEYERAIAPARAEYVRVRAPAWAEYERAVASALAEYERVRALARAEYNRAQALAFARGYLS
jgi:hypothetical protein